MLKHTEQTNSSISPYLKHEKRAERSEYAHYIFHPYLLLVPNMAIKKGPNGTFRAYSVTTGRYIKVNQFLNLNPPKLKRTFQEIEEIKTQQLLNRAAKSVDKLLFETFLTIEKYLPHNVRHVNEKVYMPAEGKPCELDLICKHAIVEVKSGKATKRLKQLLKQTNYAKSIGKKAILYAPNISFNTKREYEKYGIIVTKSEEELIKELQKK